MIFSGGGAPFAVQTAAEAMASVLKIPYRRLAWPLPAILQHSTQRDPNATAEAGMADRVESRKVSPSRQVT